MCFGAKCVLQYVIPKNQKAFADFDFRTSLSCLLFDSLRTVLKFYRAERVILIP